MAKKYWNWNWCLKDEAVFDKTPFKNSGKGIAAIRKAGEEGALMGLLLRPSLWRGSYLGNLAVYCCRLGRGGFSWWYVRLERRGGAKFLRGGGPLGRTRGGKGNIRKWNGIPLDPD